MELFRLGLVDNLPRCDNPWMARQLFQQRRRYAQRTCRETVVLSGGANLVPLTSSRLESGCPLTTETSARLVSEVIQLGERQSRGSRWLLELHVCSEHWSSLVDSLAAAGVPVDFPTAGLDLDNQASYYAVLNAMHSQGNCPGPLATLASAVERVRASVWTRFLSGTGSRRRPHPSD